MILGKVRFSYGTVLAEYNQSVRGEGGGGEEEWST